MERLTKDNPQGNHETLMNYAYAKNENVHLIYAGGEKDVDLCEYTAKCCKEKNCAVDAEAIMEGILMDCDCPIATMYWVAVQAAELRGRLKKYEDAGLEPSEVAQFKQEIDSGLRPLLPCKVRDTVYNNIGYRYSRLKDRPYPCEVVFIGINERYKIFNVMYKDGSMNQFKEDDFGKTIFFSREAAEAALIGLSCIDEKTLKNCPLIIKHGKPRQYDGKCERFCVSSEDDEPCETCKDCKLNTDYDSVEGV